MNLLPYLLILVPQTPIENVKVTFDEPAAAVPVLLRQLSKPTGIALNSSRLLDDEVLLVQVKDRPLPKLMSEIATVADGTWAKEGNGYRLDRNQDLVAQQDREQAEKTAQLLAEGLALNSPLFTTPWTRENAKERLASVTKEAARPLRHTEKEAYALRARASFPTARLMRQAIKGLDLKQIARMEIGTTAAYSNIPNRYQGRIANLDGALRSYPTEQAALKETLKMLPTEEQWSYRQLVNPGPSQEDPKDGPLTILVEVCRRREATYEFRFFIANRTSRIVDSGAEIVFKDYPQISVTYEGSKELTKLKPTWDPLTIRYVAEEHSAHIPSLPETMRDPGVRDPLSFAAADIVTSLKPREIQNVVANLPDEILSKANAYPNLPNATLGPIRSNLSPWLDFKVEDGIFLVRSTDPSRSRGLRSSRAALSALIQDVRKAGVVGLDGLTRYAFMQPGRAVDLMVDQTVLKADGWGNDSMVVLSALGSVETGARDVTKAFILLSPQDRKALLEGQELAVANVNPKARAILAQRTVTRSLSLSVRGLGAEDIGPDFDLRTHPTMFFANGLPSGTTLSVTPQVHPFALEMKDGRPIRNWNATDIGHLLARQEKGEPIDPANGLPDLSKALFMSATRTVGWLTVRYSPLVSDLNEFRDYKIDPGAKPVLWQNLPPRTLAVIKAAMESSGKILPPVRKDPPP